MKFYINRKTGKTYYKDTKRNMIHELTDLDQESLDIMIKLRARDEVDENRNKTVYKEGK